MNIGAWADFDEWKKPTFPEKGHTNKHSDWDVPVTEYIKIMPYDMHLFLQGAYNFIMEFEFDDEKIGHGYLYVTEYENK